MTREMLKTLIDFVPENEVETLCRVLMKFIPATEPLPDEIKAIERANQSIREHGTIPHDAINWD